MMIYELRSSIDLRIEADVALSRDNMLERPRSHHFQELRSTSAPIKCQVDRVNEADTLTEPLEGSCHPFGCQDDRKRGQETAALDGGDLCVPSPKHLGRRLELFHEANGRV